MPKLKITASCVIDSEDIAECVPPSSVVDHLMDLDGFAAFSELEDAAATGHADKQFKITVEVLP